MYCRHSFFRGNGNLLYSDGTCVNLLDIQLGDINGDFIVNILDIIVIVDMIVTGNIENISIADFNQDGAVNILDIVSIKFYFFLIMI